MVRICAAEAVWKVTGSTEEAVPVLLGALDKNARNQSIDALMALAQMGSEAAFVIPEIEAFGREAGPDFQPAIENALTDLRHTSPDR